LSESTQPLLFNFENRFWIKWDNVAVPVLNAACVADAFELLFRSFWVMNVEYPHDLRLVYAFFEKVLGMKPSAGKSVVLDELSKSLLSH
jgi:hypothetical protein